MPHFAFSRITEGDIDSAVNSFHNIFDRLPMVFHPFETKSTFPESPFLLFCVDPYQKIPLHVVCFYHNTHILRKSRYETFPQDKELGSITFKDIIEEMQ